VPDSVAPVIIGSGYCLIEVKIKLSSTEKTGISVVNNTARRRLWLNHLLL